MDRRKFLQLSSKSVTALALLFKAGCNFGVPEKCLDTDNITGLYGDMEVSAPRYIQQDIKQHFDFLQSFSGVESVNLIDRIVVYDPEREECNDEKLDNWKGYTVAFTRDIYLASPNGPNYLQSSVPFSYLGVHFELLEKSMSSSAVHELGHKIFYNDSTSGDIYEDWKKRGLIRKEGVVYGDNSYSPESEEDDFEEYFVTIFAEISQYAYLLDLDLPSSPVFEQFYLPSLDLGEVTVNQVRQHVNRYLDLSIEKRNDIHEAQVEGLINQGYIKSEFREILRYNELVSGLQNTYKRWQKEANRKLDELVNE